ncbi:MAG: glycosyltransferase family 1 protein [Candidatus Saccharimonas sp.]
MKLLFDARWILVENRFDGVSRYSHELAHAMAARDDLEITWLIHDKRQLDKLPAGEFVLANDPNNIWQEFWSLAKTVNHTGYQYVYSPFFIMGTLGMRFKRVLTIHDTIYFRYRTPPQWLPLGTRILWRLFHLTYLPTRYLLNHTAVVATVSDTARQEILAAHATKRPVATVPNAVGNQFHDPTPRDRHMLKDIVYMGAFTPYKNVECLIDMLAELPDMRLHLCGKLPPTRRPAIEARMRERGVSDRVVLYDGASDEQYRNALAGACCAISASRVEGFGLPVIEAQSAGVPFVCADTPIFHEIGQLSVLYFDPDQPAEAAIKVRSLQDAATSQDFIARGYKNSARYTWRASAEAAAEICHQLIK